MLNEFVGVGRWTKEHELKYSQAGKEVLSNTIAMQNPYDSKKSEFLNAVMFGKTALNTAEYTRKGSLVAVTGYISSRSYENNQGAKVYVTELIVDKVKFLESKGDNNQSNTNTSSSNKSPFNNQNKESNGYTRVDDDPFKNQGETIDISDDDLPF